MSKMIAKFLVTKAATPEGWTPAAEQIEMSAVTDKPFDADGNSDDSTFARWTPTGSLAMTITNPALIGQIKVGQKYYIDFTEAI
jgi:hypothetical protein